MRQYSAPEPFMRTFQPLESSWEDMITKNGVIKVDIKPETKRSYNVTIQCGVCRHKININTALEGLKYHHREEQNIWTLKPYNAYYLKAKSVSDLIRHTEHILEMWWKDLIEELDVAVVFHRTGEFLQLTQDVKLPEYRES